MALILLMDSATDVCSVALANDGKLVDLEESRQGLSHAELLTYFVEVILKRNNISVSDLNAVSISKGPGSYTGLRIGISAAKGLCYATGIPLIAISSLEALADHTMNHLNMYGIKPVDNLLFCPMIDARRLEVYSTLFDLEGKQVEAISAKIVDSNTFISFFGKNKIVFFGNGAEKCKGLINNPDALFAGPTETSATFMAGLAEKRFDNHEFEDVAYFEPLYLKDFIATIPKNKIF